MYKLSAEKLAVKLSYKPTFLIYNLNLQHLDTCNTVCKKLLIITWISAMHVYLWYNTGVPALNSQIQPLKEPENKEKGITLKH